MMSITGAERFEKFADLQAAHSSLLKLQRDADTQVVNADILETFVGRGRMAGVMIESPSERDDVQAILDFWATRLVRLGYPLPDTTLAEFDPTLAPELPEDPCPYRGLEAFTSNEYYYGRESVIDELLMHLKRDDKLVAIVGPSGSGKSSVILGGLLPRLKQNAIPGSQYWQYRVMVPGVQPMVSFAQMMSLSE